MKIANAYTQLPLAFLISLLFCLVIINAQVAKGLGLSSEIQKELEEVEKYEKKQAEEKRLLAEEAAKDTGYQIDPLLKEAYESYMDYENRDRSKVIALFEKYIEKEPESVFLPEIYWYLSSLYSNNANSANGESIDLKEMTDYALKAREGYKGKYSIASATINYNLAFLPGTFEKRMEYYGWLLELKNMDAHEGFYNIRSIGTCIKGWQPIYPLKELQRGWKWAQENNIPTLIKSAEKQIFRDSFQPSRNTYMDLSILAKRYPNTELGRQAQFRIDEANEGLGINEEALAAANFDNELDLSYNTQDAAIDIDSPNTLNTNTIKQTKVKSQTPLTSTSTKPTKTSKKIFNFQTLTGLLLCALGVTTIIVLRKKTHN